jgi:DNA-binding NarL/FixJ family response regulator
LIADRDATRVGIRLALADDVEVCAEAGTAEQAIRSAKREQPDVCLVGAGIGTDPISLVRALCRAAPETGVVVLANERDAEDLLELVLSGAVGYVPAEVTAEQLRRIVHAVAEHEAVIPRSMVRKLLDELRSVGRNGDGISTRQSQVLAMLRRGHTTAEIAARLQIDPVTVRRHISQLVHKLGVENRSELTG